MPETPLLASCGSKRSQPRGGLEDRWPAGHSAVSSLRLWTGECSAAEAMLGHEFPPGLSPLHSDLWLTTRMEPADGPEMPQASGRLGCWEQSVCRRQPGGQSFSLAFLGVVRSQPKMPGRFDLPFPLSVNGRHRKPTGASLHSGWRDPSSAPGPLRLPLPLPPAGPCFSFRKI